MQVVAAIAAHSYRGQRGRPLNSAVSQHMGVALFWTVTAALAVGAIVGGLELSRSDAFVEWDLGVFLIPPAIWFVLILSGVRPKSLSNHVLEPIALALVILVAFIVRAFGFSNHSHKARAMGAAGVGVCASVMLYALVPLLAE